jgi:hypothetical protein
MLSMHFTKRELHSLQLYALTQRQRADNQYDGDVDFWDGLIEKLRTIHQHPVCTWCDAHDWTLADHGWPATALPDDREGVPE